MANEQNLKPFTSDQNREKAAENGRKGGKASGEAKRRKKEMRERLELLLSMPINSGKGAEIEKIKSFGAIKGKNITVEDAILIAIAQKAMKGDISAGTFIRDTVGEKPTENKNVTIMDTDWFTE
jgi:hypothetical protein